MLNLKGKMLFKKQNFMKEKKYMKFYKILNTNKHKIMNRVE